MFRSCRHLAAFGFALALVATGCQRELTGRPSPEGEIYFPLGMAVNKKLPYIAYVVSTDWSEKYNTGWLSAFDLRAIVNGATSPSDPGVEIQTRLLVPALGGELTMSRDTNANGDYYMIVSLRGNNDMGVFEIADDGTFNCGDPAATAGMNADDRRSDCDRRHLYSFTQTGVDRDFLQDQFRSPFGVRFLPPLPAAQSESSAQTIVVGFQVAYRSKCLASFLDVDFTNASHILGNQRSIDLRQDVSDVSVQSTAIVAAYPSYDQGQYVAVAARVSDSGTTEATIYGIDLPSYDFEARFTDDDDYDDDMNRAMVARVDIRSQAGGFNLADLKFSSDGTRAFAAVSYSQPVSGSSDGVIMLDTTLKTRQLQLPQGQSTVVQRPEYTVLDTLPIHGAPQNVLYMERAGKVPLLVTATFDDNALHFIRVDATTLDTITRVDRSVGEGPVMIAEAHFALSDGAEVRDYVLVAAFLNHTLTLFDVTDDNPGNWSQYSIVSADLSEGDRYH